MRTIYEPEGRAAEYSALALNLYTGCGYQCRYCYNRFTPWFDEYRFRHPEARPNIVAETEKCAKKMQGDPREILLCFTCDPYQGDPAIDVTREILEILERYHLRVQILSKGGMAAVKDFDILQRNNWRFGASLSCGPEKTGYWEPLCADIHDRLRSLETAKKYGISTFISIEPAIEVQYLTDLMATDMVRKIVDEWRLGKLNYHPKIESKIDWAKYLKTALTLLAGKKVIIKKDLADAAIKGVLKNEK